MHLEIAKYFEHFYSLVIKPKLFDTLVDSEWNYFLSMFKAQNIQKDRLELYFNIIQNERKIKPDVRPFQTLVSTTNSNLESTRAEQLLVKQITPPKHVQLATFQHSSRGLESQPPQRTLSCKEDSGSLSLPKRYSDHSPSNSTSPSPAVTTDIGLGLKLHKASVRSIPRLAQIMKKLVVTFQETQMQLCRG